MWTLRSSDWKSVAIFLIENGSSRLAYMPVYCEYNSIWRRTSSLQRDLDDLALDHFVDRYVHGSLQEKFNQRCQGDRQQDDVAQLSAHDYTPASFSTTISTSLIASPKPNAHK